MPYSLPHLHAIRCLVSARIGAGDPDADDPRWKDLLDVTDHQIAASSARRDLVFRIELPIEPVVVKHSRKGPISAVLPVTMNEYGSMPTWKRSLVYKAVDKRIVAERTKWPRWHCGVRYEHRIEDGKLRKVRVEGTGRRRLVKVTRWSSRRPDEAAGDSIGGKIPTDRIRCAEIIVDDSAKWIDREAAWEQAAPGEGRVVVEVYEIGETGERKR